jgi:hypothetical protein
MGNKYKEDNIKNLDITVTLNYHLQ